MDGKVEIKITFRRKIHLNKLSLIQLKLESLSVGYKWEWKHVHAANFYTIYFKIQYDK